MVLGLLLALTLVVAVGLTGTVRRYAVAKALLDQPNRRGSHTTPTPRGGGAAIVMAVTAGAIGARFALGFDPFPWTTLAPALGVAAIGFIDDHRHVPAVVRLTAHFVLAAVAVSALAQLPDLSVGLLDATAGAMGTVVAVLLVVWFLNLTNFMDGIDGIAGVQTVTVFAAAIVLLWAAGIPSAAWTGGALLTVACAGFLWWNWPPARIFMGDVGSGFLGFLAGMLTLEYGALSPSLAWPMILLSGTFVVDATVTLAIRAWRRESLLSAHRSHAYQMLAVRWQRHLPVTLLCGAINLLWLLPLAWLAASGRVSGAAALALAWLPLVVGVWWVNQTARPGERIG